MTLDFLKIYYSTILYVLRNDGSVNEQKDTHHLQQKRSIIILNYSSNPHVKPDNIPVYEVDAYLRRSRCLPTSLLALFIIIIRSRRPINFFAWRRRKIEGLLHTNTATTIILLLLDRIVGRAKGATTSARRLAAVGIRGFYVWHFLLGYLT